MAGLIRQRFCSLAGQSTLRWLGTEARKHYGCALSKINDALKSEKTAVEDDVLCSIILAGFYENIVGDNLHVLGSHRTGLSLLLKMRGPAQLQTIRGRSLFRHACSMYRIFNYNTGSQPLSLIQDYRLQKNNEAGDFENHFVYGNLAEQTDRIAAYCADFKAFYTSSQQLSPEERVAGLTSFLDQAETQRTELNLCMETIMHKNWRGFRHDFMPGITTHETPQQPPYIVTYADMSRTPTANLSRTCLMFLGEIAYLCHSGLEDPLAPLFPDPALASSPTTKACIASVRGLIDEVNASIPFMVDDVDASANITADQAPKSGIKAFVSIWSLWIVKSSALAERAQVAYAEQGLAKIAGLWGICLAAHVGGLKRYDRYGVVHRGKW
ncbi:MAG: hypothetical protein LQ340_005344 [Diploschistes diacapsis]|nr:MAG: hypothetical protein LQ340_005344 [Diploschistes diacapsis]